MKIPNATNVQASLLRSALVAVVGCLGACASQPDIITMNATASTEAEAAAEADAEITAAVNQFMTTSGLEPTDVICVRERLTGTRMKRKICKTIEARLREQFDARLFVRTGGRLGRVTIVHMMDIK